MPRIRTLKPDFFRSPDTAKVGFATRIFYQALWCWADDFGIGETNINGLLGFAFPDEDEFTAQDVRRFCAECAQHYGVTFYTVRGRHFYYVPTWEKHQKLERRSERRKNPPPDDPDAVPDQRFPPRADSAPQLPRNNCAESGEYGAGTGEQGNRGTGEALSRDARASRQRRQPNFGEMVRGEPDPVPDAPPADTAVRPVAVTTTRQTAERLVKAVSAGHPTAVVRELVNQTNALLLDDQPEQLVGAALQLWSQKGLHPKALPALVSEVIASSKAKPAANAGIGKPTQKALGHELAGAQLLAEMGYEK